MIFAEVKLNTHYEFNGTFVSKSITKYSSIMVPLSTLELRRKYSKDDIKVVIAQYPAIPAICRDLYLC